MASPLENGPPPSVANVEPDLTTERQARLVFDAFKETLSDLDRYQRNPRPSRSRSRAGLRVYCRKFRALGGMLIFGYFRLEAKIDALSTASTRTETKLDDALQRDALQPPGKQGR